MKNGWLLFSFCTAVVQSAVAQQLPPIGSWREHLPFNNAVQVAGEDNLIHCATPFGFFTFDKADGSFERRTKVNGLNEVRVRLMAKEPAGKRMILVYENSNVDILDGARVLNIPDIMLSSVSGDRSVNAVLWRGSEVLLSTGLGIIVLNPDRREVKDTYRPSSGGDNIRVNGLAWVDGFYYAATAEGLKRAASSVQNLSDFRNWQTVVGNGLSSGACNAVASMGNALAVLKQDTVFLQNGTGWRSILADGWPTTGFNVSGGKLFVSQSLSFAGRVAVIDVSGAVVSRVTAKDLSIPRQAVVDGAAFWVADQNNGLIRITNNQSERIFPNSPINISSGDMTFLDGSLWAAAGAVNEAWNYLYNPNGLYTFKEGVWENINLYAYPKIDSLLDLITIAGDPATGSVFAGSFGGGLLEISRDRSMRIHKQQTGLQATVGDPGSYRVAGLAFDENSNLWISNYGAPQNLVVKRRDGIWKRFTIPFLHTENAISQILIDEFGRKWIVSPKGNGLFCFDDGGTMDNISDDRWRYFRQGKANGNLPSSEVHCIATDRDGFIWVGTSKGIAIVQCIDDVFSGSCEAFLPVVQQDDFAGYLFGEEEVRTIAVDGANRKWIGTKNGVWLVSSDGSKVIHRFTETNSPLLSNIIHRIAIDPITGEVFISTFNGICSFRGTATVGREQSAEVLVFPNPVPPGFAGTIAIRGLMRDAIVKITEPGGRLVYQTRALGGQAVWNGRNYKGEKVASGAYLVIALNEEGKERIVTKIFLIK